MLFFPQEAAKLGEMPLSLDEPPITEEDTKPKAVKIEAMGAVAAVSVAAGAIAAATGKEDEATPAVLEDAIASEPEITEEQPALVETSELGEEVTSAPGEPTGELAGESAKPIAEGVVIPEEDDAFAWLESLAARQGAEEALLLAPEERQETPPEWVIQEAAEAEAALPDETLGESELPDWLQAGPEATPEAEPAGGADASVPDWLDQPAAITEETIEAEGSTPLAPELPTWLAGIEDAQKGTEPAGWEPSNESFEVGETLETIPEIAPESLLQATPEPALDLNQAGLVDLERLPGVGFIKAQAILDYRQQHGSFQEVDELLLVAGITPEILLDLKHYLRVGGVEAIASFELPVEDQEILLVQARNALVQGDISLAISRYALLIEKKQMLPEVINDLNEALYRFPIDISIWEALGDAHMHSGHLQDALNAYTKAEEYLHE
jgi:competence ComEA-like helix-hairpin-helix protein